MPDYSASYETSLADVIFYDLINSPSLMQASFTLWSTLLGLTQRGFGKEQINRFLVGLEHRLYPPPKVEVRFSGQTSRKTLEAVNQAREKVNDMAASEPSASSGQGGDTGIERPYSGIEGPYKTLREQIRIAQRILATNQIIE